MSCQFQKAASACLVLLLLTIGIPFIAQAQHGGHELEKDLCVLGSGQYRMYFNSYQPDTSQDTQFCQELPMTGRTVVVFDFFERELREMPLEVRIVRDTGSEQDLDANTVFHIPPKLYPSGSVDFTVNFDKPGKFICLVTITDKEPQVARFPFSVATSDGISHTMHYTIIVVVLVVLAIIAVAFIFLRGRRKPSEVTAS
jgi:hypothetical protein